MVNGSELELRDAILIDQAGPAERRERWLGTIAAGAAVEIDGPAGAETAGTRRRRAPAPTPNPFLAELRTNWEPREENQGELRLVAWVAGDDRRAGDRAGRRSAPRLHRGPGPSAQRQPAQPRRPALQPARRRRPGPRGSLSRADASTARPRPTRRPASGTNRRRLPADASRPPDQVKRMINRKPTARDGVRRFMIEVINFTKRYGDFVAVDNLSFTIGKGEIFGFIGPNGAGKSTTIRFLATLLAADRRRGAGRGLLGHHRADVGPPRHRLHARRLRRLRRHEGLGVSRLLRRRLRDPPLVSQEDHRRGARAARPDPQARRLRQRALQGDEAAALPGQDPGPRPARADPRRAGLRASTPGPGSR